MGWLDSFQDDHDDFHHKGSLTHDALGGAVAYEAVKAYENHLAKEGKPDSHAKAKEILAGFAAAALTQVVETKGADLWDDRQKKRALERAQERIQETVLVKEYDNY